MKQVLHILTRPEDSLAAEVIAHQQSDPLHKLEVVDLSHGEPDYAALLQKIFAADSVEVW